MLNPAYEVPVQLLSLPTVDSTKAIRGGLVFQGASMKWLRASQSIEQGQIFSYAGWLPSWVR